jgi:PAS domain S-box-containing protein
MNLRISAWRSLKTRVTILTLAILVLSIWVLTFYASRVMRDDMQRLVGDQQFSTASIVAAQINGELEDRLIGLERYAGRRIASDLLDKPAALQQQLEQSSTLQSMFNAGLFVTDASGTPIADVPVSADRLGRNVKDRDYMVTALKEGKSSIGRPVVGKSLGLPVFSMAAPIRDAQGNVIGAVVGVTDLGKPNFLDHLTQIPYGKAGSFLLVAPQYRLIVTASDKLRVMETLPAPGINATLDQFILGHEGSKVHINLVGVETIASVKKVPLPGWYVAVQLPTTEAFAPIQVAQERTLVATIFMTLLAGSLTWLILRRQLEPLMLASRALSTRSDQSQRMRPLPIIRPDEIGELIGSFNRLLADLSEHEQGLHQSQQRLRSILDCAPTPCVLADSHDRLRYVNPAFVETFGYSLDDGLTVGALYRKAFPDSIYRGSFRLAWRREMEIAPHTRSRLTGMEVRVTCANGQVRTALISAAGVPGSADGEVVINIVDISERKHAEHELKSSERLLRESQKAANIGSYVNHLEAGTFDCTAALDDIFGITEDYPHTHEGWAKLIHPDFVQVRHDAFLHSIKNKKPFDAEYKIIRPSDGVERWIHGLGQVACDDSGKAIRLIGTVQDVTERKIAQEQLRKLSLAIEQSPNSIVITDVDSRIEYVNDAFVKVSGYQREEVIGQNPRILNSGKTPQHTFDEMWEMLQKGQVWRGEFCNKTKNGREYDEFVIISPLRQSDGRVTHYVAVKEDLTERKAAAVRIQSLAFSDLLTGLPNRRMLIWSIWTTSRTSTMPWVMSRATCCCCSLPSA